jgi:hypothetical protein
MTIGYSGISGHRALLHINEKIVLGLGHSLGERQVPPLDFVVDTCLAQSSRPPRKVRAIDSQT